MQSSSTPEVPYFPLANGADSGHALINEYKAQGRELIIVHELCALNMFQTRLNLNMYKKRKLWSKVAENAIHLSGIQIQSLGKDDDNREYWKFPNSDFIFVCCPTSTPSVATSSEKSDSTWKILTTTEQMQAIVDKLGCSFIESKLAQNLIEVIKNRNILSSLSSSSSSSSSTALVNETNDESNAVEMENDDDDDKGPFELRLIESKGNLQY